LLNRVFWTMQWWGATAAALTSLILTLSPNSLPQFPRAGFVAGSVWGQEEGEAKKRLKAVTQLSEGEGPSALSLLLVEKPHDKSPE
jgi:hypothetical protein